MKILVADKFPATGVDRLTADGHKVDQQPTLNGDTLLAELAQARPEILVVRSTKVTEAMFEACPSLALVVRAGAGVNTIDVAAAAERGVFVSNCPGKNAAAVAELALGLILASDRQIPNNVRDLRAGQWNKKKYSAARGVLGQTLGLIGFGRIGQLVAARAKAFGMHVLAYDIAMTDELAAAHGVERAKTLLGVAERASIVSLHVAATPKTRGMIDATFFDALAPDSTFINTSRGTVVDEAAMHRAVVENGLRCGVDVYSDEPSFKQGEYHPAFVDEERVVATHHIGASTAQAQDAVAAEVARVVSHFATRGVPANVVNLSVQTPASCQLIVRHLDKVGVLAGVFDVLRRNEINVQGMENIIFDGAAAAVARIELDTRPDDGVLEAIGAADHVISAALQCAETSDNP